MILTTQQSSIATTAAAEDRCAHLPTCYSTLPSWSSGTRDRRNPEVHVVLRDTGIDKVLAFSVRTEACLCSEREHFETACMTTDVKGTAIGAVNHLVSGSLRHPPFRSLSATSLLEILLNCNLCDHHPRPVIPALQCPSLLLTRRATRPGGEARGGGGGRRRGGWMDSDGIAEENTEVAV